MDRVKFRAQLTPEEGDRKQLYDDKTGKAPVLASGGNITGGIGHNFTANPLSQAVEDLLFNEDCDRVEGQLSVNLPWWKNMADIYQRVLADLCFNMGIGSLLKFTTFLGLMSSGQYILAASDLKGTAWYGQVKSRGPRLYAMLLTGLDPTP